MIPISGPDFVLQDSIDSCGNSLGKNDISAPRFALILEIPSVRIRSYCPESQIYNISYAVLIPLGGQKWAVPKCGWYCVSLDSINSWGFSLGKGEISAPRFAFIFEIP